jgi:hypothetical protein
MCVSADMYVYVYMYVYAYIHVCAYVCIYYLYYSPQHIFGARRRHRQACRWYKLKKIAPHLLARVYMFKHTLTHKRTHTVNIYNMSVWLLTVVASLDYMHGGVHA